MHYSKNTDSARNIAEKLLKSPFISKLPAPNNVKRRIAFTLAEILISLLIIGVVASIVIPAIIQDTQDTELRVKWRKTFSDISNVTKMIYANNLDINFTDSTTLRDDFANVMQFIRKDTWWNIAASKYIYYKNTQNQGFVRDASPALILSNGGYLYFASYRDNGGNGVCTSSSGTLKNICGWIAVDINGKNTGPNMFGMDFFQMWIVKSNGQYFIYPFGSHQDGNTCENGSTNLNTSFGCSTMALYEENLP